MNLFDPRTFSFDWEVMVVDKLERCTNEDKLRAFAGVLRSEFDIPVSIDWYTLEFAMGINQSLEQLWSRIQKVTDRATQLVREFDLDLFPAGAHPVEEPFNAAHIHVGTILDEAAGLQLENQMLKYSPAFAALAANSPASRGRRGGFKSYRVKELAYECTVPGSVRDPNLSQNSWGNDVSAKLYGPLTVEVRVIDCASSRRFLAELATFIAAYVHYRGTQPVDARLTPEEYRNCMTNRWAAARHGLQATFAWNGGAVPVVEVLDGMLDECRAELEALGAKRSDLPLIHTMLRKRTCQADFVLNLAERYPDPVLLASAYRKLARHWDVFDGYVDAAPALEPAPLPDGDAILAEHLSFIGEGSHFYRSRETMCYPAPVADEMIRQLVERRLIRRDVVPDRGILLSRMG